MCNPKEPQKPLTITVQYRDENVKRLSINKKGNWIDLYAADDVTIPKGKQEFVHLGVAIRLPEGYEAHLAPRSSTFKNWHIIQTNSVGVIDNSYSGPNDWWKMPVYAMEDTVIKKDEKIAQFRIMEIQPKVELVEGKMEGEDRGGFGSTGKM